MNRKIIGIKPDQATYSDIENIEVETKKGTFVLELEIIQSHPCPFCFEGVEYEAYIQLDMYLRGFVHQKYWSELLLFRSAYSVGMISLVVDDFIIKHMDLRSVGVGTFILNKAVLWAKRFPKNMRVCGIELVANDEILEENGRRRDKLYANVGYCFEERFERGFKQVLSVPMTVNDLQVGKIHKNIKVIQRC